MHMHRVSKSPGFRPGPRWGSLQCSPYGHIPQLDLGEGPPGKERGKGVERGGAEGEDSEEWEEGDGNIREGKRGHLLHGFGERGEGVGGRRPWGCLHPSRGWKALLSCFYNISHATL